MNAIVKAILEFLKLFGLLHLHWAVLAGAAVLANRKLHLNDELFRKLLHLTAVFAIIPIVLPSAGWLYSASVCAAFALEAYLGVKFSGLKQGLGMKERGAGEQQRSMLLLFGVFIFLIAIGWGVFGQRWMPVLSVVAWGVGDAFAALIGKPFGKHKIRGKHIQGTKSVEGSVAMFVTSFLATYLIYRHHTAMLSPWVAILVSFWVALFACLSELFSKNGMDTVFCPVSALIGFVIMTLAAGGI